MIIRQTLNFAAHFALGIVIGALGVAAAKACQPRRESEPLESFEPEEPATEQPT